MVNERGFYCVITQDRIADLQKFLKFLLKFNNYPVYVAVAVDRIDAHRKKAMVGHLSPFNSTVLIDTDILVNGELDYLFEKAEQGLIAIHNEVRYPERNSGVVAIPNNIKQELSNLWLEGYEKHVRKKGYTRRGTFDQGVLSDILNHYKAKFPEFNLPDTYNFLLKYHTPEEEEKRWDEIKIFHFLHCTPKEVPNFKSWRVYHGLQ